MISHILSPIKNIITHTLFLLFVYKLEKIFYDKSKERQTSSVDNLDPGINPSDKFYFTLEDDKNRKVNESRNLDGILQSQNNETE